MRRQVVILRHRLWAVSTYKNIYAAEKMRADLQDADKMPSHCWSIGPGRTMLIFSASDFGDGFKGGLFSLICTYQSRFPSTPSGSLSHPSVWMKKSYQWRKCTVWNEKRWSESMMRFHPTWIEISKSIKRLFNDALCLETLLKLFLGRDALESPHLDVHPFLLASLFLLLALSETQSDAR